MLSSSGEVLDKVIPVEALVAATGGAGLGHSTAYELLAPVLVAGAAVAMMRLVALRVHHLRRVSHHSPVVIPVAEAGGAPESPSDARELLAPVALPI